MIERFEGDRGRALLVEELSKARLVAGVVGLAEELVDAGEKQAIPKGSTLIEQNDPGNDVYFIVAGAFDIVANGNKIAVRWPGELVGEMAAVSVIQNRSATVVANDDAIVLKVSEELFSRIAEKFPIVWRRLAEVLSRRLLERNKLIRRPNEKI